MPRDTQYTIDFDKMTSHQELVGIVKYLFEQLNGADAWGNRGVVTESPRLDGFRSLLVEYEEPARTAQPQWATPSFYTPQYLDDIVPVASVSTANWRGTYGFASLPYAAIDAAAPSDTVSAQQREAIAEVDRLDATREHAL
jgi:hypothetical protein